ncbi:phosphate ABC transporter permease PstA [uncultured Ilumatobacter sp.]|jgi:phosphate transport system permease protein|uniref:phosphate ABC transporter permease PstA n=1 Tax=uncultured Ilumatobacter sp. TaxID=879968 RepID=UPI00374E448F
MTLTTDDRGTDPFPDVDSDTSGDITSGELAGTGMFAIFGGAVVLGALTWLPSGSVNWARWVIVTMLVFIMGTYVVSRMVESKRHATDRLATAVMASSFAVVLLPLISVVWTVVERGSNRFDWAFYTETMRGVVGEGGGAYHAIIGTLIITALATSFSVPFGLFTAIYLVEYGGKTRFAKRVTGLVDVMTGIPSIVAGLFAYALFVLIDGPGHRSGLSGAIALTLLMTPVVIRASDEMLRLVPNELREASYALGVPKWKTIAKIVLPTAVAGILTGIVLSIARVIGETAPLLITVGIAQGVNYNPLSGRIATLPVFTYNSYAFPTLPRDASLDRAWASALTLVIIVAVLFTGARILSFILKPKGLK